MSFQKKLSWSRRGSREENRLVRRIKKKLRKIRLRELHDRARILGSYTCFFIENSSCYKRVYFEGREISCELLATVGDLVRFSDSYRVHFRYAADFCSEFRINRIRCDSYPNLEPCYYLSDGSRMHYSLLEHVD